MICKLSGANKMRKRIVKHHCGLCGKTRDLVKTGCCGNWICNDEHKYIMFSYARNSCSRNHSRYTLCSFHCTEKHEGLWKDCKGVASSLFSFIFLINFLLNSPDSVWRITFIANVCPLLKRAILKKMVLLQYWAEMGISGSRTTTFGKKKLKIFFRPEHK